MESHRDLHRSALRQQSVSDRRTLPLREPDQLQQPFDRVAAQELRPHLRRPRAVARPLHAPVFAGSDGPAALRHGRHDRQLRHQSRDMGGGVPSQPHAAHHGDDGHRGLLRAHRRLAFQHGASGQNGSRRRHHGRHPGADGAGGLRTAARRRRQLGTRAESARIHLRTAGPEHFQPRTRRGGGTPARQGRRLQITDRPHADTHSPSAGSARSRRPTCDGADPRTERSADGSSGRPRTVRRMPETRSAEPGPPLRRRPPVAQRRNAARHPSFPSEARIRRLPYGGRPPGSAPRGGEFRRKQRRRNARHSRFRTERFSPGSNIFA